METALVSLSPFIRYAKAKLEGATAKISLFSRLASDSFLYISVSVPRARSSRGSGEGGRFRFPHFSNKWVLPGPLAFSSERDRFRGQTRARVYADNRPLPTGMRARRWGKAGVERVAELEQVGLRTEIDLSREEERRRPLVESGSDQ